MIPIGIDTLSFSSAESYLDLQELALARGIEPDKFFIGLGQEQMAVAAPDEDIVTLGARAAKKALRSIEDPSSIGMLLFATESGIDQSKAAGIWIHHLLGLSNSCRIFELKQACYAGTAALKMAISYVMQYPKKKVLVIASDIAKYGLNTPGEPTQGCGAIAMVIGKNPRLIVIEEEYGCHSSHVMDFWRPNYLETALVDGKYSTKVYLETLALSWEEYKKASNRAFSDHQRFCYHLPFTRMAEKAHLRLAKINKEEENVLSQIEHSLIYPKKIGNSYTAALYIGLLSLLDNYPGDLAKERVAFFSYGSGCVGEFFSGIIQKNYQEALCPSENKTFLSQRKKLTLSEYEEYYSYTLPQDGNHLIQEYTSEAFRFCGINKHERIYVGS